MSRRIEEDFEWWDKTCPTCKDVRYVNEPDTLVCAPCPDCNQECKLERGEVC